MKILKLFLMLMLVVFCSCNNDNEYYTSPAEEVIVGYWEFMDNGVKNTIEFTNEGEFILNTDTIGNYASADMNDTNSFMWFDDESDGIFRYEGYVGSYSSIYITDLPHHEGRFLLNNK